MKKIALPAIIIFMATTSFGQTKGTLNLTKGQKYVVENKLTTKSNSEMQGQSMESNANVNTTYSIEVKDLKDNNYNMTNSISSVKMNMTSMGQNVNFDSEKKEDMDGEIGSNFKKYINHPNTVMMDKSGNVIVAATTDTSKKEDTNPASMMMKQLGDPEQQGYGATLAFAALPKNLKTGSSWKDSTTKDGVTRVTNYSVKDIKGKTATIALSGTETRDTKMEMQGMEISTKTSGKFSGEETVDVATGVVLQNNTTADAKGNISVMGQEIPTTISAVSVTTVKPI